MEYYIAYKGKPYRSPMSKEEAEMKLIMLSKSFDGLAIVSADTLVAGIEQDAYRGARNHKGAEYQNIRSDHIEG